jgi:hypothetical protein
MEGGRGWKVVRLSTALVVADCKCLPPRDPAPPRPCLSLRTSRAIANPGLNIDLGECDEIRAGELGRQRVIRRCNSFAWSAPIGAYVQFIQRSRT